MNDASPGLDLTGEFIEAGRNWSELDDDVGGDEGAVSLESF